MIPILKGLGIGNAGLIVFIIALIQMVGKECRSGSGTVMQIRLHIGVIGGRKYSCDRQHARKTQRADNANRIHKPPSAQAAEFFHVITLSGTYAPHL